MTTGNGHIIWQNPEDGKQEPGAVIPLSDGRFAVLRNERTIEDGHTYLMGIGADQSMRTYTGQRGDGKNFKLVPEGEPAGIKPRLILLFRVINAKEIGR